MKNRLFEAARKAMANSHSPYSSFPVGAAIVSTSGTVYSGCNIENASYPEGWCAETSAIAHMVTAGDTTNCRSSGAGRKKDKDDTVWGVSPAAGRICRCRYTSASV